ncbi:hypothetical protein T07_10872 [Trichinella nelsoni]|uniref:Uncharacterized protein n=1 Tax=Trichinella nelsoni TaxID=6336 RepID=A0A0V0SB52_9BILA|nr:hypothetical protein T07_10872 [Trichinella nelsoni]
MVKTNTSIFDVFSERAEIFALKKETSATYIRTLEDKNKSDEAYNYYWCHPLGLISSFSGLHFPIFGMMQTTCVKASPNLHSVKSIRLFTYTAQSGALTHLSFFRKNLCTFPSSIVPSNEYSTMELLLEYF